MKLSCAASSLAVTVLCRNARVGAASSSMMLPVAVPSSTVARMGLVSSTLKRLVAPPSSAVLSSSGTVMVWRRFSAV